MLLNFDATLSIYRFDKRYGIEARVINTAAAMAGVAIVPHVITLPLLGTVYEYWSPVNAVVPGVTTPSTMNDTETKHTDRASLRTFPGVLYCTSHISVVSVVCHCY